MLEWRPPHKANMGMASIRMGNSDTNSTFTEVRTPDLLLALMPYKELKSNAFQKLKSLGSGRFIYLTLNHFLILKASKPLNR